MVVVHLDDAKENLNYGAMRRLKTQFVFYSELLLRVLA